MRRRWAGAVSGVVVAAALLASPLASIAAAQKATGAPIPVTFLNLEGTSSTAPAHQGAQAAVRALNRTGGIGGRPIRLTECRTDQSPEKGKACMDAAAAAKPAAVLAVQPGAAADALASLAPVGVPYVGQTCNTNATLSGQFSTFCFGSDFVGLFSSSANYLKTIPTVKRVGLAYINVPAASTGVRAFAVPIFQRDGLTPVEIPIPDGTTDVGAALTPAFQTAPDALVSLVTGPGCISIMKDRGTLGATKPFIFPALCTDQDVLNDVGPNTKGLLFVRQTMTIDKKNADVKTYAKAMKRFASSTDPDDMFAQAGFASVMNLAAALRTVPAGTPVDAASATAALQGAKSIPLFLNPDAAYTCDGTAFPGLKALCSIQAHVVETAGKDDWVDKGLF